VITLLPTRTGIITVVAALLHFGIIIEEISKYALNDVRVIRADKCVSKLRELR
jgi:hypothetical protein